MSRHAETPPGKPKAALIVITVLFGFAMSPFFCCAFYALNHPGIDPSLERKITRGMTKPEVRALLGPPSSRDDSDHNWTYDVGGKWTIAFFIQFDEQGKVLWADEWRP
jgi:hypothetical protein